MSSDKTPSFSDDKVWLYQHPDYIWFSIWPSLQLGLSLYPCELSTSELSKCKAYFSHFTFMEITLIKLNCLFKGKDTAVTLTLKG